MHIPFIEIQNFRKLKSIRIDFDEKTTVCVGANNSGKTSAMLALGHFLVNPKRFTTNDFTLSNWISLNKIGAKWENDELVNDSEYLMIDLWQSLLPSVDIWLAVEEGQFHYARNLIPSLDWAGGHLGVRITFEPKNVFELAKEYLAGRHTAINTKTAGEKMCTADKKYSLNLWPHDMRSFLDRKLHSHFVLRYYLLDSTKCVPTTNGVANAQKLPKNSEPLDASPLRGLIRIDEIPAQRGLDDSSRDRSDQGGVEGQTSKDKKRLSDQLKSYYAKHLDPSEYVEPEDLDALQSIETAQEAYNERLTVGFTAAIKELEDLNYPGVTDPQLTIATRLRPIDGLSHNAAVQYSVMPPGGDETELRMNLPEEYNGLGYQNLISMVFKLMSFRDAWMRVGKADKSVSLVDNEYLIPPLHLVMVEEPEAYLHAQVQQVFLRKAYDVLRNHANLKSQSVEGRTEDNPSLQTQLIVSTHSSHIAHECDFACLRYFRRQPALPNQVPTSTVINLSQVFGAEDETRKFVQRYIRATHCDLFFADAAILIEGASERMLIPHFIRSHFDLLNSCYITVLEIDGSHAHRLRPLIEHLGLISLIVTDIDSVNPADKRKAVYPKRAANLLTCNTTLKEWHPELESIDELLNLKSDNKVKEYPDTPLFSIRVAYQVPINVKISEKGKPSEVLSRTFEDALVLQNLEYFRGVEGTAGIKKIKSIISSTSDAEKLVEGLFQVVQGMSKAEFALDLLFLKNPSELEVPEYIFEGLEWLERQLDSRDGNLGEIENCIQAKEIAK